MKGQSSNPIEMAPQGKFGVPRFSHGILIIANLRSKHQMKTQYPISVKGSEAMGVFHSGKTVISFPC